MSETPAIAAKAPDYLGQFRAAARAAAHVLHLSNTPFSLVHFITNRCNLRCDHCFIYGDFDHSEADPRYQGTELSLPQIVQMTKSLRGRLGMVSLTGGEPFLRRDIAEVVGAYTRHGGARIVAISTHGHYLDRMQQFVQRFLRETDAHLYLMFSFDGPEAIHDANRGLEGAFQKTAAAARHFLSLSEPRVEVAATVSVFNQPTDAMVGLLHYLRDELGVNAITTSATRGAPVEEGGGVTFNAACHRELNELIAQWTREGSMRPFAKFQSTDLMNARGMVSRQRVEQTLAQDRYISPCTAGRVMAVVHANGTVYPCEMLDKPLGNLLDVDMDLPALMRAGQAKDVQRFIRDSKCFCSYECAWSLNVLFEPRNWAEVAKAYAGIKAGRLAAPDVELPPQVQS